MNHCPSPSVRSSFALALLAMSLGCTSSSAPAVVAPPPAPTLAPAPAPIAATLSEAARDWVETSLAAMSLEQKAAQMIMVRAYGQYHHPDSYTHRQLLKMVREEEVGGVVLFDSDLETIPRLLNELQAASPLPLLISADLERGLSFRVKRGATSLPYAMAIGATRSAEAARFLGEITAREGRALGIHWALAPVADVNNNPANPVINVRSFGEEPELVSRMVSAFVQGARAGGMLTSVKHFPGHGDTGTDSHFALPVITADRAHLDAVELVPFRGALAAGVDSVMVGHIAVPALDPTGTPATLSPALTTGLLRDQLGFDGLVVTDGMEMRALNVNGESGHPAWSGGTTVAAVQAGADVILLPANTRVAIQSLVRAVGEGQLTEVRLDASVRRILEAKARLGLHRQRLVDPAALGTSIARPQDTARAAKIAAESITLVRNQGEVLPLAAEAPLRLLHLTISSDFAYRSIPPAELAVRRVTFDRRHLGREISPESEEELITKAGEYTHIVVSAFVRASGSGPDGEKRPDLSPSQAHLLHRLAAAGPPVILLSFGSPYLLAEVPEIPVYLCAYGNPEVSQRAAFAALFGESAIGGKLPVRLPGLYPVGHGEETARRAMSLEPATAAEAGFTPQGLAEVDKLMEEYVVAGAFPGAVVAIGHHGKLAKLHGYGKLSYDNGAAAVTPQTIYDLASLTKVIATTTMAMMLVDRGQLDLDSPVQHFLPRFTGAGKEKVTLRHLLTHSSGIDWWAPLFKEVHGKRAYIERIQAMELVYEPGTQTKYSDLGLILLGEILERVAGQPLESFVQQRVFGPLGMNDTLFRPLDRDGGALLERIAPTEFDPGRGRIVRGEVHDENAFALGGVAPHAGLFSTARDLARFVQMIANGGVFEHRRLISRPTVERFTRRAHVVEGSDRALGWDTKSAEKSSAGTLFSPNSFGHTGFTGTSIWIDPERDLFLILLTNRVHPTRDNIQIRQVRPALADAVVRALVPPPVRVGLERLDHDGARQLQGKRIGLVVHGASRTWDGHHAIDLLQQRGLNIVRLFSPEHGLRGQAAAGEKITSGKDPVSGLPVVSLYGKQRKPRPEDLADLDTLVFDLQGAGVRFYTYVSTLIHCLEAAGQAGIEFIVLDRPNPLGGDRVEGPTAAPRDQVPASFVNLAPGPLVHGLTLGEMARYVNSNLAQPAKLTVIPMAGWHRSMSWVDTGRPWIPPSPNLRTAKAALAYPGIALLEVTNLSEGRGTETPFLLFGAPWLDPAKIRVSLPGFTLTPTTFTPRASKAAPSPKYLDQECHGFRVHITDPALAQPYRLGVELLAALATQPGFEWRRDGAALTWLIGSAKLHEQLPANSVEKILDSDRADQRRWREARARHLLY